MSDRHPIFPIALILLIVAACGRDDSPSVEAGPGAVPGVQAPAFVGTAICVGCHEDAAASWSGSHHDLAMQPADATTVLGDFDDTRFEHAGVTSRFTRRDGRYYALTDGPNGSLTEYEIAYAFGVAPLQQYLIEFTDGRLQALGIAWDTRSVEEGGQRWFHVYGDERIDHADELHWTRLSQNWNYMCADCHSTGYRKNYDAKEDSFDPSWADIDVACEACHGPGSRHVALAEEGRWDDGNGLMISFADPDRRWVRASGEASARIEGGTRAGLQIEACGRCHARRAPIRAEYGHGEPLADSYVPALLTEPLYFPDGQIRDEVYVYGSFLQSRMYAAGVVCTDCHQPHSLQLKGEGDGLCAQCHAPEVFASVGHNHHQEGAAPTCVDCHMPSRDYMVIDGRRDHSFRVPRPDLAVTLGVTDACDACHADRPDGWSAESLKKWLGRDASGYQQFAEAFRAAQAGHVDAAVRLKGLLADNGQPAIVRATALRYLGSYLDPQAVEIAAAALYDPDPLVRLAVLDAMRGVPSSMTGSWLIPLLEDPVRAVRTEVARQLADIDPETLSAADRQTLQSALAEYVEIQTLNADRPEARLNLALVYARSGRPETAERQLRAALRLQPDFIPGYVNLADLYRGQGDEAAARAVLEEGLAVLPDSAAIHHSLGLLTVRTEGAEAGLSWLRRAVEIAPASVRYRYVLAVALNETGRQSEAIATLEETHELRPADVDVLYVLAVYLKEAGDSQGALEYAVKLRDLRPGNPRFSQLVEELS